MNKKFKENEGTIQQQQQQKFENAIFRDVDYELQRQLFYSISGGHPS